MRTPAELIPVLDELRRREPIFHRSEFGGTLEDFERLMAEDYWEVGASGRQYGREFILRTLAERPPVDCEAAGWECSEFACRRLGPDTFLVTYRLDQAGRISRRATIWRRDGAKWQILFHQGTLVEI